ncbi:MAG: hypothetical protein AB1744_16340, partial [Candidatus Zixiibacteriota bacterium]
MLPAVVCRLISSISGSPVGAGRYLTCTLMAAAFVFTHNVATAGVSQEPSAGSGDVNEIQDVNRTPPVLLINDTIEISPLADDTTDLVISLCGVSQTWSLLNEITTWCRVNIFGYYTDPGVGSAQTIIFDGAAGAGAVEVTGIPVGTPVGLWLLNDIDSNGVFSGDDSYLFSERSLTAGSTAGEHQWFMVFDVSAYKGTGATYYFNTDTEDYTHTGDFDYLIYIDDNHTSADFDHNDMIVGITCPGYPPEVTCPRDTMLFICAGGQVT